MGDADRPPMDEFMEELGAATLGDDPSWEARKSVYDDWREWGGEGVSQTRLLGERNTLINEHGLPANEVKSVLDEFWRDASEGEPELEIEEEETRPEIAGRAEALLRGKPDPILDGRDGLLDAAYGTMTGRGLVGEETNAKVLYLAALGGCLGNPIHVALHGASSAGKNELVRRARELFPPELVQPLTGMSRHALEYRGGRIEGVLVVQEAEGQADAEYELREAMSEGKLTRWTVDEGESGMEARELEVEIDASIVTTTTKASLHPENATRVFSLEADDSPAQTDRVLDRIGREESGPDAVERAEEDEVEVWRELVRRLDRRAVWVPYAPAITDPLPNHLPRARRDAKRVMALIKSSALLHQRRRETTQGGGLVAAVEDYRIVYPLLDEVLEPTLSGLTDTARDIIRLHKELADDSPDGWVKRADLEDKAGRREVASSKTVRTWSKELSREGIWEGEKRKYGAWWHREVHDPDSGAVNLPHPEELKGGKGGNGWKTTGSNGKARREGENVGVGKGGNGTERERGDGSSPSEGRSATNPTNQDDHPVEDGDERPEAPDDHPLPPSSTPEEGAAEDEAPDDVPELPF